KPASRAVKSGRLGSVQFHDAVVDAQPGQCGQYVFDQTDLDRRVAEGGATLSASDSADVGGEGSWRFQVGAHENDPAGRRGRQEAQSNGGAGQVTRPSNLDRPAERSLLAVTVPSHVRVILDR